MSVTPQANNIRIPYRNGNLSIPRHIIQEYASDLSKNPHFSSTNVDVHMRFLYVGNLLVVHEFLAWYHAHDEFDELCLMQKED